MCQVLGKLATRVQKRWRSQASVDPQGKADAGLDEDTWSPDLIPTAKKLLNLRAKFPCPRG